MIPLQALLRDILVRHANELAGTPASRVRAPDDDGSPPHPSRLDHAKIWLTSHRLLVLHDHPDLLPPLREHLDGCRRFVLAKNLLHIQVFTDLVRAFTETHSATSSYIPVAPLKGMSLTDSVYRHDISLRPMGDLDLLVPSDRIDEAIARLAPLGLREPEPSYRLRRVMHHRMVLGSGRGPAHGTMGPSIIVELHTRLGTAFIPHSFWPDVAPSPAIVYGVPAHRLPPATELAYLLVHFYKHRPFSVLGWLDELLALAWALSPDDQHRAIPSAAARLGCRNPVAITVDLIRRALAQLGPSDSHEPFLPHLELASLCPSPLRTRLHRWVFHGGPVSHSTPPDLLCPRPPRHKLIEELHAPLLVDRPLDALGALGRQAISHFLARYPTRLGKG